MFDVPWLTVIPEKLRDAFTDLLLLPLPLQVKCWTRTCATTSVCSFRRARWTTSSSRSYGTTSTCAPSHVSSCTAASASRHPAVASLAAQESGDKSGEWAISVFSFVSLLAHLVETVMRASHSWKCNTLRSLGNVFFCRLTHRHAREHTHTDTLKGTCCSSRVLSSRHPSVSHFSKHSPTKCHHGNSTKDISVTLT